MLCSQVSASPSELELHRKLNETTMGEVATKSGQGRGRKQVERETSMAALPLRQPDMLLTAKIRGSVCLAKLQVGCGPQF